MIVLDLGINVVVLFMEKLIDALKNWFMKFFLKFFIVKKKATDFYFF